MRNKKQISLLILGMMIGIVITIIMVSNYSKVQSFEQQRKSILEKRDELIAQKVKDGEYKCCIEPACTMCFMGNWLWDDGICRCDDMIAAGEFDKVCPQCQRGIEEGQCKSTDQSFCEIDLNGNKVD